MRIGRVRHGNDVAHATIGDDAVELYDGPSFAGGQPTGTTLGREDVELLVPVEPTKLMCVGRNYAAHIVEMGFDMPTKPSLFMKPPTALCDPGSDVVLPPEELSTDIEHEAELVVVIGDVARNVAESSALDYVAGFTCANDVSARDLQRSDPDVVRAKGFDTFCPMGPWIETDLDIASGVGIGSRVNGEVRQDGSTSDLIFDVPHLIAYLSRFTTLLPGDVILTGSPGGSGPMRPGDAVEIWVEGIGVLHHGVRS